MLVQSLASGSSGNALLLKHRDRAILIDCGISPRSLGKALAAHKLRLDQMDGILVTHEHADHVRGLDAIRVADRSVICTEGTAHALGLEPNNYRRIAPGCPFELADLEVIPIATSHDANESCGFSLSNGRHRITLLTDLGCTDDQSLPLVAASQLIVLEANHDSHMLRSGPYPAHLKRRVASHRGHLSNGDCGGFLARALRGATTSQAVWLAHLSAVNNRPALAVASVMEALARLSAVHPVVALPRSQPGPFWSPDVGPIGAQLSLFG